jgi:hypothetical protein
MRDVRAVNMVDRLEEEAIPVATIDNCMLLT